MKDNREWKAEDIPFKEDRNAPGSLTKQMANGLREAIASQFQLASWLVG